MAWKYLWHSCSWETWGKTVGCVEDELVPADSQSSSPACSAVVISHTHTHTHTHERVASADSATVSMTGWAFLKHRSASVKPCVAWCAWLPASECECWTGPSGREQLIFECLLKEDHRQFVFARKSSYAFSIACIYWQATCRVCAHMCWLLKLVFVLRD